MPITLWQALKSVTEKIDPNSMGLVSVDVERVLYFDEGYVVPINSKEYVDSRDDAKALCGGGSYFVELHTGKLIHIPSYVRGHELFLTMYRLGYTKYDNWDLIVTSVRDVEQTISMLDFLRMTYIIPEEENGVVWKIPKKYSLEQIAKKLTDLPASFNLGSAFVFWEKIEKFKKYEHFSFDLTENEGYLNTP